MLLLVVSVLGCSTNNFVSGTLLQSPSHVSDFELKDQFGDFLNSRSYRGKVVVLTFLYTHCFDICPTVASYLREARGMLGGDVDQVSFIIISVDPSRDTVEQAYAYSEKWGMLNNWSFLVGSEEELAPVWRSFYIDPVINEQDGASVIPHLTSNDAIDALMEGLVSKYDVVHSAPVYLIDREGLRRILLTLPFTSDDLAHDIRTLLE